MHVPHFKARPLPGKASRTQCGQPPLVGQFRKRVGLVHELGELAAAEELLHGRDHGARVNKGTRRRLVRIRHVHAIADGALHAKQPDAELLLDELEGEGLTWPPPQPSNKPAESVRANGVAIISITGRVFIGHPMSLLWLWSLWLVSILSRAPMPRGSTVISFHDSQPNSVTLFPYRLPYDIKALYWE